MYILTNGSTYIRLNSNNTMEGTGDKYKALQFKSKEKAENALSNLPKTLARLNYYIEANPEETTPVTHQPLSFIESNYFEYTLDDIIEIVQDFVDVVMALKESLPYAEMKKQLAEKEICDIEHAIEFYNYNACDGYKVYKLLQRKRLERREAKDIMLLDEIIGDYLTDKNIEDLIIRLKGVQERMYRPRINQKIFEKLLDKEE